MTVPEPSITVGLGVIYQKLLGLESSVNVMGRDVQALRGDVEEFRHDAEGRFRALEATRIPWGRVATLAGIMGTVVATVAVFVK